MARGRFVALLFGISAEEVERARRFLAGGDKEYTLNNIAAQLRVKTPPDLRDAARKKVEMNNLAVDAGYPSDFIGYVLRGTKREENAYNFSAAIREVQSGSAAGVPTKDLLQEWANQQ